MADLPQSGEIVFWTADIGIDGQTPVDLDDLNLVCIDPLPSWVWYQDMADFAEAITDERTGRRLARAIQGRGPSAGSKMSSTCLGVRFIQPGGKSEKSSGERAHLPLSGRSHGSV